MKYNVATIHVNCNGRVQQPRARFKIYLCNLNTIGAMCGYGEGRTREDAIADALRKAREMDPKAFYEGGQVYFRGGVNA